MQDAPEYCLLATQHWMLCMTKSEWAAWVQAIGSIAAILGAAYGVYIQMRTAHRQADEQDRRLKMRKYHTVINMLARAGGAAESAATMLNTGQVGDFDEFARELQTIRTSHNSLSPFELPDPDLAFRLALVDQSLRTTDEALENLHYLELNSQLEEPIPISRPRSTALALLGRLQAGVTATARHCQARMAMIATQYDVDEMMQSQLQEEELKRAAAETGKTPIE